MGCAAFTRKSSGSTQDFNSERSKLTQFQFKFKIDEKLNIKLYKLNTIKEEMQHDEFSSHLSD